MTESDQTLLHTADDEQQLKSLVERMVDEAARQGADGSEVRVADEVGVHVTARNRDLENVEFDRSRSFGICVYLDQSKGICSTSDTSDTAIVEAIERAIEIAKNTESDPYNGLPEKDRLARDFPDLDTTHPLPLDASRLTDQAIALDTTAMDQSSKLIPSDGSSAHAGSTISVLGNSLGFLQSHTNTHYGLYCEAVATDGEGNKQVEGWSCSHCDPAKLDSPEDVGKIAAERAISRLAPRAIKTGSYPILFDPHASMSLFSALVNAISGEMLYMKRSYLCDSLGKQVAIKDLTLTEYPFLSNAVGSSSFDRDGVATEEKAFIKDGVVESYALGTYSARRLGMSTTGNAGRICNLTVDAPKTSLNELMQSISQGVLVTQLKGAGPNLLTGDYSTGVAGFWIENGEVAFPVENITIAGKLPEMYNQIIGYGDDVDERRSMRTGSTLIESMTVAAS